MKTSADDLYLGPSSDIAIIGMVCRVPGASNIDEFWQNLKNARESVSVFDDEVLRASGIPETLLRHPRYVKSGTQLTGIDLFDAEFFGFTAREAEAMDPQHRLFLEAVWELMEMSGYSAPYPRPVGIYAGVGHNAYWSQVILNDRVNDWLDPLSLLVMNDKDFLSTMTSYKLNLKGPSLTIQTACSTSLVAVHLACQGLLAGDCTMAVAGGVKVIVPETKGYLWNEGGIHSPDGHCRPFDERAQGTIAGSGVGVVLLKRLKDASADGDHIHAVIKGTAINNDGSLKVNYTSPSVDGQARVIRAAHIAAAVEADTISYIEAHGTGTPLGDPIEIAALTQAFRSRTSKSQFCAVGSVKGNIGHLDTAAGVIGLIKTVLALEHKKIPASLNFASPNPQIDFRNSPFFVNTQLRDWSAPGLLRAGVSSFGFGGTNAHVVLEEAPVREDSGPSRSLQLLLISAKTEPSLERAGRNLSEYLKQHPKCCLPDVAYTLQVGRKHFTHRLAVVCSCSEEAIRGLETGRSSSVAPENGRHVVFLFPGQGTQYVEMGRELYETEAFFRDVIDRCCETLWPILGIDLRNVMYPTRWNLDSAREQLRQSWVTLPALFVIEYALARLWIEWGIQPTAMFGHSLGEYTAACIAGVITEREVLELLVARGRLVQEMSEGSMMAVDLPEPQVKLLLPSGVSLAAINAPDQCVVSGPLDVMGRLEQQFARRGIVYTRLPFIRAFHSEMMEPMLKQFDREIRRVNLCPPRVPYVSSLTGEWIRDKEATDPNYWVRHLREPVSFARGMKRIVKDCEGSIVLEVGPGHTLSGLVRRNIELSTDLPVLSSIPPGEAPAGKFRAFFETLGRLWSAGASVDWQAFNSSERRHRVQLPVYQFDRKPYWVGSFKNSDKPQIKYTAPHKLLDPADWFYVPCWKRTPLISPVGLAGDHCWLLYLDEYGLGSEIAELLRSEGQEVFSVCPGDQFEQNSSHGFTIRAGKRQDCQTLFKKLHTLGKSPTDVVHLWSLSLNCENTDIARLEHELEQSFYSLLYLGEAVGTQRSDTPTRIYAVSNNLHDVIGEAVLCPARATLLGPCRAIPEEYPHTIACNIDVHISTDVSERRDCVKSLLAEFGNQSTDEVVAYRGGHRWVPVYEPYRIPPAPPESRRIKMGGVYLITGGLGGLGLAFAEDLARFSQASLVLIGKSDFPKREAWSTWLDHHEERHITSERIRKLLRIENCGSKVKICQADVSDEAQMSRVVEEATQHFGMINGVIHAAGVPGGGVIELRPETELAKVLAPKVKGTLVLEQLLKQTPLDFFVLCSSLTGILGGAGQADYVAANAFLDSFAHSRKQSSNIVPLSVDWDGWKDVGMLEEFRSGKSRKPSVTTVVLRAERNRGGAAQKLLSPSEGCEVLRRVLSVAVGPQIAVSTRDLVSRVATAKSIVRQMGGIDQAGGDALDGASVRPRLSSPYVSPRNELERAICEIWRGILGLDKIGIDDNFLDLGGESLIATRIAARMRKVFDIEFTVVDLYKAATVSRVSETIIGILLKNADELDLEQIIDAICSHRPKTTYPSDEHQQRRAKEL